MEEWKGRLARGAVGVLSEADGHGLHRAHVQGAGRRRPATAAPTSTATSNSWGPYLHLAGGAGPADLHLRPGRGRQARRQRAGGGGAGAPDQPPATCWRWRCASSTTCTCSPRACGRRWTAPREILDKARKKADEEYADNSGKVTNVDIQRLAYGARRAGEVPHPGGDRRGPGAGGAEAHHGAAPERRRRGRRRDRCPIRPTACPRWPRC